MRTLISENDHPGYKRERCCRKCGEAFVCGEVYVIPYPGDTRYAMFVALPGGG
jgi:hypothetical protein